MANDEPFVSIGLPVFNGDAYLKLALDSLVAQTYRNFEIVVSDNGSTDGTGEICKAYSDKHELIRSYRYEENRGIAWNRNNSFHLSKGEYFMWFSHDDVLHEEYLEKCMAEIQVRQNTCIVYSKIRVIDADGETIPFNEDLADLNTDNVVSRFKVCLSSQPYNQSVIYGLMRRSDMASTRLHGDYLAADRCLVAQLSLKGKMYQIPEYLFYRRKHADNFPGGIEAMAVYQPGVEFKFVFKEWNVLKEHLRTVGLFDAPIGIKLRLYIAVASWFLSQPKRLAFEVLSNSKKAFVLLFRKVF